MVCDKIPKHKIPFKSRLKFYLTVCPKWYMTSALLLTQPKIKDTLLAIWSSVFIACFLALMYNN